MQCKYIQRYIIVILTWDMKEWSRGVYCVMCDDAYSTDTCFTAIFELMAVKCVCFIINAFTHGDNEYDDYYPFLHMFDIKSMKKTPHFFDKNYFGHLTV